VAKPAFPSPTEMGRLQKRTASERREAGGSEASMETW